MNIKLSSVLVDDQGKALTFYTESRSSSTFCHSPRCSALQPWEEVRTALLLDELQALACHKI